MNLWAKRTGQLVLSAVALFFFSCQEDLDEGGYPNPNTKFEVRYVEIPLESSVLLRDSLRTTNYANYGEVNRFLIGSYQDEAFGTVTSSVFSQFFTASTTAKLPTAAVYDSVVLQLRFDLSNYGSKSNTEQSISVYELVQDLKADSLLYYFNRSNTSTGAMLGSKSFTIMPSVFDDHAKTSADADTTVIVIRVKLDQNFGQRIFNAALAHRDYVDDPAQADDVAPFVNYTEFIKEFKGIAIKPDNADKLLGINPQAEQTRIFLHFHQDATDNDSLVLPLTFGSSVSYNQIKADRSASELGALTQYYQDYLPASDKRYVQAGTGIITKLDFSNFFAFADTVDNILINSAELVIEDVEQSPLAPPAYLSLRTLMDSNRPKIFQGTLQDTISILAGYNGLMQQDYATSSTSKAAVVDGDHAYYATGDQSPLIGYSSTKKSYSGVFSLFLQQLALKNEEKPLFKYYGLYAASQAASAPAAQSSAKSANRAIFPKNKIKLKISYTKPTAQQ